MIIDGPSTKIASEPLLHADYPSQGVNFPRLSTAKVTDAIVEVEGENLRQVTWVKINEVEGGNWAIGGQPLQAVDIQRMATG